MYTKMDNFIISTFLSPATSQTYLVQIIFFVIFAWSIIWKGSALYHAARNEDKLWFVAIILVNTLGLLEIAYLFYLSKNKITLEDFRGYLATANKLKAKKIKQVQK